MSGNPLFSIYNLGKYQETLRTLIHLGSSTDQSEFPVLISKGMLDGKFVPGILFPVGRGRYGNNLIMQSIVLNGIVFDCVMANTKKIPDEVKLFSLSPIGRVFVPQRGFEELGMDISGFSDRFKKPDVKAFFSRHG